MKVMYVASYIYDEKDKNGGQDSSGLAIIVNDLIESVAKQEEIVVLTRKKIYKRFDNQNIIVIPEDNYTPEGFKKVYNKIEPSIVHIHYIDPTTIEMMRYCQKASIPYLVTFHLYIGNNISSERDRITSDLEKEVFKIPDIKITVVSSGMRDRIVNDYPELIHRIYVIPNAVNVAEHVAYKNKASSKIKAISVGTICERKNQMMLVEAAAKMSKELKSCLSIVFVGRDRMDGQLQERIKKKGLTDICEYAGGVSRERMVEYYKDADIMILPSRLEGFCLAALEALSYGIPVILSKDLDFVKDLGDNKLVYPMESLTTENIIKEIESCIRDFQNEKIWGNRQYLTMSDITQKYINVYKERRKEHEE